MGTKKILTIFFSTLFILAFGFVLVWGIINFNKVKDAMSGTGIYTEDDIKESYNDGYNKGIEDKQEFESLINGYRDTITTQRDEISNLTNQVSNLTFSIKEKEDSITKLENQKSGLESQIQILSSNITNNESIISELNSEIKALEDEKEALNNEIYSLSMSNINKDNEIALLTNQVYSLDNQIKNLNSLVNSLEETNASNLITIKNLNNSVSSLKNEIYELKSENNNIYYELDVLNREIEKLNSSISYYEEYIRSLETENNVVVTFMYNGSVINIQVVTAGSFVYAPSVDEVPGVRFIEWSTPSGVVAPGDEFQANETMIIDAVVEEYSFLHFVSEGEEIYSCEIGANEIFDSSICPVEPTKDGYVFSHWTLNGIKVDFESILRPLLPDLVFEAEFSKIHQVTYLYDGEPCGFESVVNDSRPLGVDIPEDTEYIKFNGWLLNGVSYDLKDINVLSDITLVADLTYSYDVVFEVNGEEYSSEIVEQNKYVSIPDDPTISGLAFIGWSIDGSNVVDLSSFVINSEVTFMALFVDGGLFDHESGMLLYSFDELIDNNYIVMNDGVLSSGSNIKNISGDLVLTEEVTSFSNSVFKNCVNLKSVVMKDSVESLSFELFYGCTSLENVVLSSNITVIPGYCFYACSSLTKLDLPDSVATLQSSAFAGSYIEHFDLSNITYLGEQAFYMSHLVSVVLPEGLTDIYKSTFQNCKSLTDIVLPSTCTSLASKTFYGCSSLKILNLENLEYIGSECFYGSGLSGNVKLLSIKTLSNSALQNCSNIETIYLASTLETISNNYSIYCNNNVIVYVEFDENTIPVGLVNDWSVNLKNPVVYNCSYNDYLSIIGA